MNGIIDNIIERPHKTNRVSLFKKNIRFSNIDLNNSFMQAIQKQMDKTHQESVSIEEEIKKGIVENTHFHYGITNSFDKYSELPDTQQNYEENQEWLYDNSKANKHYEINKHYEENNSLKRENNEKLDIYKRASHISKEEKIHQNDEQEIIEDQKNEKFNEKLDEKSIEQNNTNKNQKSIFDSEQKIQNAITKEDPAIIIDKNTKVSTNNEPSTVLNEKKAENEQINSKNLFLNKKEVNSSIIEDTYKIKSNNGNSNNHYNPNNYKGENQNNNNKNNSENKKFANLLSLNDTTNKNNSSSNIKSNVILNYENISNIKNKLDNVQKNLSFQKSFIGKEIQKETIEKLTALIQKSKILIKDNNNVSMTTKLHPRELGKMTISLVMQNGILNSRLIVENEVVHSIIENKMQSVMQELKDAGQNIGKLEVLIDSKQQDRNLKNSYFANDFSKQNQKFADDNKMKNENIDYNQENHINREVIYA